MVGERKPCAGYSAAEPTREEQQRIAALGGLLRRAHRGTFVTPLPDSLATLLASLD